MKRTINHDTQIAYAHIVSTDAVDEVLHLFLAVPHHAMSTETPGDKRSHSLLELRGLGKEIWEGVDAQRYVDELRNEWDRR